MQSGRCDRCGVGTQANYFSPNLGTIAARGLTDSQPSGSLPERICDLPPLSCPNEMQVLSVHRGSDCDSRNGVVDIYDLNLNPKIVDDAGAFLAHPPGRGVNHLSRRCRLQRFGTCAFASSLSPPAPITTQATLRQLRMQRSLHPDGVTLEPPLEVIEHGAHDGRLVAGRGSGAAIVLLS